MRLSSLSFRVVLVVLLFSAFSVTTLLAQHSGGGGGGGASASSGGSHGGGGGGSSSASSASHSSGGSHSGGGSSSGSSNHAGSSHGSSSHGSGSGHSPAPSTGHPNVSRSRSMREPEPKSANADGSARPAKRGFFSFFRHPFPRRPLPKPQPEPEPVAAFSHRVCLNGFCRVCPVAQQPGVYGCLTPRIELHHNLCGHLQDWNNGLCGVPIQSVDDCSGLRAALQRQIRRMEAAEAARRAECINGNTPECSDLTGKSQSEASFYQKLQERYARCRNVSPRAWSFSGGPSATHPFDDVMDPRMP